jgi:hypothetical protein
MPNNASHARVYPPCLNFAERGNQIPIFQAPIFLFFLFPYSQVLMSQGVFRMGGESEQKAGFLLRSVGAADAEILLN